MSLAPRNSRNATRRRAWFTLLVCSGALFADALFSWARAAGAPVTNVSAGRYLLIVDTSLSMQRRAANTQKLVGDLLLAGLNGQLRPGDTIGVWTFSDELNAGNFPLQQWMPQARQRIASSVVEFLQGQRHEKQALIDKALTPMLRVIQDSDKITVLIISGGDDKISGTPFDDVINEACKLNSPEQRKSRMPLVTVLRARKGEFIGWKVSMPPWPVEFPTFPAEPMVAETPRAKESPKTQLQVTSTAPSLVVVGKKPGTAVSATNIVPLEATKPEPTPPAAAQPAQVRKPETSPAATTAPATNPTIVASPEPAVPQPTRPAESPQPAIPTTQGTTVVPDKPKTQAALEPPRNPAESSASTNATTTAPTQTSVAQTAVVTPAETVFNRRGILIAGVVLLLVALGLVHVLLRRPRTTERASLITRSLDQDKK